MRVAAVTTIAAGAGLLCAAIAEAQITPEREYYGVNRPIPVRVETPPDLDGEVEVHLLAPVSAEPVEVASAEAGRVDLSTLFPVLWTRSELTLLYAQLVVGGEKVGPALVLEPLLAPRRAIRQGRGVTFPPDSGRVHSGLRAWTDRHVVFETSAGEMAFALRPDQAPNTVRNLVDLAEGGFYTDIVVHRVVPNFVIQFGDPTGSGAGGPGYNFDLEPSALLMLVPSLSQATLITSFIKGETVSLSHLAISVGATSLLAALAAWLAVALYKRERMLV